MADDGVAKQADNEGAKPGGSEKPALPLWFLVMKELPTLVGAVGIVVLLIYAAPFALDLVRRGAITNIEGLGFKVSLVQQAIADVKGLNELPINPYEANRLQERFKRNSARLATTYVLWVDDQHPQQNASERRILEAAGIKVELARSTEEAKSWLLNADFHVLITDLDRPGDKSGPCFPNTTEPSNAGCAMLEEFSWLKVPDPKYIAYVRNLKRAAGHPPRLFRMTDDVVELLDSVLDAVERR